MADQLLTDITRFRRSPLARLHDRMTAASVTGARDVALREIPFLNMVGIRARPGSAAAEALAAVAEVPLPAAHGAVTGDPDGVAVVWQGPDEFLLVSQDETVVPLELTETADREPGALISLSTHPLTTQLCRALAGHQESGQVVDLSANRTTLELSGHCARAVLEKGCHLDLHPRVFEVGTAVSTTLGPVQVILWRTAERTWRIMPRASFAEYVAHWLMDAMTEFASSEVP